MASICPNCYDGAHAECILQGCYCSCQIDDGETDTTDSPLTPAPPLCSSCKRPTVRTIAAYSTILGICGECHQPFVANLATADTLEAEAHAFLRPELRGHWTDQDVAEFARSREAALRQELRDAKSEAVDVDMELSAAKDRMFAAEARVRDLEAALQKRSNHRSGVYGTCAHDVLLSDNCEDCRPKDDAETDSA